MLSAPLRLTSRPPLLFPRRVISSSSSSSSRAVRCYWSGLESWRAAPLNEDRAWGADGPRRVEPLTLDLPSSPSSLAEWGSRVLSTPDPLEKAALSHAAFSSFRLHNLPIGVHPPPPLPARPPLPPLVTQKEVPSVKNSGLPLNAYLLHGLAHVELNAIDLAWDTMVRFSPFRDELGDMFFSDFARVADDESRHFLWCSQRISELGFSYGDMPAHNLLWRECERSSGDVAARLAVIPLVQEARGLDAGPRHVQRMMGFGDHVSSSIVAMIAEEEVAHVAVGVCWFLSVCAKMGRTPGSTFNELLKEYNVEPKGPFNYSARDKAGIPRKWYDGSIKGKPDLSEVQNRLASVISMEKDNCSLES